VHIQTLALQNFKNHLDSSFVFSPHINFISGLNGTGKTSILDAIYCLGFTKSYFQLLDKENIMYGKEYTAVHAECANSEIQSVRYAYHIRTGKKLWVNQELVKTMSSHIGKINMLFFAPYDVYSLVESNEEKKRSFDMVLCQLYPEYLHALGQYQKTLKQRNALLKQLQENEVNYSSDLLAVYDSLLEQHGNIITTYRKQFFDSFLAYFQEVYAQICDGKESPSLSYEPYYKENFAFYLSKHHHRDIAAGRTLSGVHKDEISYKINGLLVRKFASQGQQKTYILSIKLAQYLYIAEQKHTHPILLLDDICDKLDPQRLAQLFTFLNTHIKGQIFITDTQKDRFTQLQTNNNYQAIEL
jgi:DNA replication and repair protein RecF